MDRAEKAIATQRAKEGMTPSPDGLSVCDGHGLWERRARGTQPGSRAQYTVAGIIVMKTTSE